MFTGLVEAVGSVVGVRNTSDAVELRVDLGECAAGLGIGASVALSGVCCTVTAVEARIATFWLSPETLRRTWFSALRKGHNLNVERCLRAGDPMGGHIVQGHVDGVGEVVGAVDPALGGEWRVRVPHDLARYCVAKGSIALDGVSLTIASLAGAELTIALIPHTATHTTIGASRPGDPVNVEVDVLAKYVERLLAAQKDRP